MNYDNYLMDDLIKSMLDNSMVASKVSCLRTKSKNNKDFYREAYKKYKSLRKDNKKISGIYYNKIEKWNNKYPNSFRYRSPDEIFKIIKKNQKALSLAWNYVSPCKLKSKLKKDLIDRTKRALILYYTSLEFYPTKFKKLLKR